MRKIFTFLLIVLLPTLLVAQVKQAVSNRQEQTVNKELEAKIDSLFASINNTNSPGAAVTVMENGKVITKKSYGMASIEHQVPFTHQTVVKMPYSEGREFISIAVVLMERDGILKLDDKVRKYFPKLPAWAETVTLWDLLNHRSGFVDEWAELLLTQASMANRFDRSQFLNLLYNQPTPSVEPGKGYMYSNSDFGLLRLILEKASGKNLPDWLKQRVFDPLKMHSTRMENNPLEVIPNKAIVYIRGARNMTHAEVQKTSPGGNYFVLTTAEDLEKWSAAHADSTTEIAKAAARLLANVRILPGKDNHYVVGYSQRKISDQAVVLHEGVLEYNYLTRIPAKGIAVITLGNRYYNGFSQENKAIVNYLLNANAPSPEPTFLTKAISVPTNELLKYEGRYIWQTAPSWQSYVQPRPSKFSDFFVQNGVLKVRMTPDYPVFDIIPVGKDVFVFQEGQNIAQFTFSRSPDGAITNLEVKYNNGYPPDKMVRGTIAKWQPSKRELSAFTGKYYSKHLDFYWTIEVNDEGKLVVKRPTVADTIIEPESINQFQIKIEQYPDISFDAWILFHKDQKGNITHFTVWFPRMMHHRFDRIAP